MRKLFFQMGVSLDGYFEGPNGSLDWHILDDDFIRYVSGMLASIDGMIMGRVCYEHMAAVWPTQGGPFAKPMNELPKYVFSRTRTELPIAWQNSRLVRGDTVTEIAKLKAQPGKDLSIGGSDLVASLADTDLVDEYRIIVTPVVLGAGRTLLHGIRDRLKLKLAGSETFGSGVVLHTYRRG